MIEIKFEPSINGSDAFNLYDDGKKIGEMIVEINGNDLTVYHTGVNKDHSKRGYASQLFTTMVKHAREHNLKIIAVCPFTYAQLSRNADEYADIWDKNKKA